MASDRDATEVVDLGRMKPVDELPGDIRGVLKALEGPARGRIIYLDDPVTTIGRNDTNAVVLPGSDVSGRHAMIFFTEGLEWRIEDLGSTNGTLLNGSKVKAYALREGDKILIGAHLMLFSLERL
jgi:eukaryotic-like serine/threonine-protein kinase